jgi:hypothetical protein
VPSYFGLADSKALCLLRARNAMPSRQRFRLKQLEQEQPQKK